MSLTWLLPGAIQLLSQPRQKTLKLDYPISFVQHLYSFALVITGYRWHMKAYENLTLNVTYATVALSHSIISHCSPWTHVKSRYVISKPDHLVHYYRAQYTPWSSLGWIPTWQNGSGHWCWHPAGYKYSGSSHWCPVIEEFTVILLIFPCIKAQK